MEIYPVDNSLLMGDSLVEIEEKTIGLFFTLTFRRKARYYECE